MSHKLAVFYHCLFFHGEPPELRLPALDIISGQMTTLKETGLLDAAAELTIGINGGEESLSLARMILPNKARLVFHGLQSKAENLTLVELEKWLPTHPDWYVLYFHAKGCTHDGVSDYAKFSAKWRHCLMCGVVHGWRQCVADLDAGFEAAGNHWMTGLADGTQNIFAGNFWWAKASYLNTLPSIWLRDRIKVSGIAAVESRYEAEVWIGNGARLPNVKDYATHGLGGCP